jgi:ubiquinone/menaquinone biosynthesis C-methylase UbiE
MDVKQRDSDSLWRHYQDEASDTFESSYSRQKFIAKRCSPGTKVLNIGVGSGYLESLLKARDVDVYCLDPSASSVRRMNEQVVMEGHARQGYSHENPFPDLFFDVVIMTEVIEHIQKDHLDATILEVRRVLKSGGRFVGTVPYKENLRSNEVFCPNCSMEFHRWGHLHSFDLDSVRTLLERNGMTVKKAYTSAFPDFSRPKFKLLLRAIFRYVLGRIGEPLVSPCIYFSANK